MNLLTADTAREKLSFSFFSSGQASPSAHSLSTTSTGHFLKSGGGKLGLASTLLLIALIFGTYGYVTSPSQPVTAELVMGGDQQAAIIPMVQPTLTQPVLAPPQVAAPVVEPPKEPSCPGALRGGFCVLN